MRVIIAPDKFKGSLSAIDVARAMAQGVARAIPGAEIELVPMADGGEGTVAALVEATGGQLRQVDVTGPLGSPVRATYGLLGDSRTAVVEMASASGLVLVPEERRDPRKATTRGTGELLLAAAADGVSRIIVGIGGSATNDGGAGMAQVVGYRLLDAKGRDLEPGGGELGKLARIEAIPTGSNLKSMEISVACDVNNTLCGPDGASAVYGPQKGADPQAVAELDRGLSHFASIIERDLGVAILDLPGSGAAGGLGGGLVAFLGGRLRPGIDLVVEAVGLAERLQGADLCLTGEGALDRQSAFGKTAVGVSRRARALGCPTLAIVGMIDSGAELVLKEGISAYFSLCPGPIALDQAMKDAAMHLTRATEQACRAFLAGVLSKST